MYNLLIYMLLNLVLIVYKQKLKIKCPSDFNQTID